MSDRCPPSVTGSGHPPLTSVSAWLTIIIFIVVSVAHHQPLQQQHDTDAAVSAKIVPASISSLSVVCGAELPSQFITTARRNTQFKL